MKAGNEIEDSFPLEESAAFEKDESLDDLLEDVEFDLYLSSLDLSGLEGYRDEDGFLEIDDVNWISRDEKPVLEIEYEPPVADDEISMLSDEDRERMEELQVVDSDDSDFAELEPLITSLPNRSPFIFRTGRLDVPRSAIEELPVVADSDISDAIVIDDQDSQSLIELVDGVFTINNLAMNKTVPEDPDLKALADSVLSHDGA